MSIVTLGARSAVLAIAVCLALASPASAANPYTFTCWLNPSTWCVGSERHTYDKQYAVASINNAYIASWFVNPGTGNAINVIYGWGASGGDYRVNTDLWLDPVFGNFSGYANLRIDGAFHF